jgi:broad specificity phosphatase PhoE
MRVVDHFRHSIRSSPGKHLTREGVALARRVGDRLGDYDLVVTSKQPRAIETAIAMGYASDRQIEDLFVTDEKIEWGAGFAAFAETMVGSRRVAKAARKQAEIIRSIAAELPQDGKALVVSHGGVIELGVVGLLSDFDYSSWGSACERCEGVRIRFDGETCLGAEVLRIGDLVPVW